MLRALLCVLKVNIHKVQLVNLCNANSYHFFFLTLHIDSYAQGAKLQLSSEVSGDIYQSWTLRTDGTIISKKDEQFGLGLVQVNGSWTIQIVTTSYYAWRILYGIYETCYSEQEKREISYLVSFQRIVLTLWTIHKRKKTSIERKGACRLILFCSFCR